mgnify:CR=1 FL=1
MTVLAQTLVCFLSIIARPPGPENPCGEHPRFLWKESSRGALYARHSSPAPPSKQNRWEVEFLLRYIVKRLLMMIPIILAISFIIFSIISLTPGDPAQLILGADADPALLEAKREEWGLNDNFLVRYVKYIGGVITGDFGESYRTGNSVLGEIASRLPKTMVIALGGIGLSVLVGVPLGLISAVKQYSFIDYFARVLAMLLTAIPAFWLGLMSLLYVCLKWRLLPATGGESWDGFILPILVLAASATATQTRTTRSAVLESIRQDYVKMARAKGVKESRVIFRHVLRNSMLPVITIAGMNIGVQMGGTVVIENVFAIAGMGNFLVNSVRVKDAPAVVGTLMVVAAFIAIMNLVVDLIYTVVDPRLKTQYATAKKRVKRQLRTTT